MTSPRLVLASRSPRRHALLAAVGLDYRVDAADIDEEAHLGPAPRAVALKTAFAKAREVAVRHREGTLILAADTMVVLDGEIFGKPRDADHARAMLGRLSDATHTVITGLALMRVGGETLVDADEARVRFAALESPLIDEWIAGGEATDKAGAYGIQGLSSRFVADVDGDLTCVIGLPLARLRDMLGELGLNGLTGADLRAAALRAFPDLNRLPAHTLRGIPVR